MQESPGFIRVSHVLMYDTFYAALLKIGFTPEKASVCSEVFTTNSLEGVYTHGVNRFTRFIDYIQRGFIDIHAEATRKHAAGCIEQWDGLLGPGIINAIKCTDQALVIAQQHGIGCVALANTNHWMRGGYYGWRAVEKGFVLISWTNTNANMPAWGAVDSKVGNNPLVIAVPYQPQPIVLDTAMSQYSYGSLDLYKLKNEKLPTPGGYDQEGNLTDDAHAILETRRVLPIGFWKGAGMSLLFDVLATILSAGLSTAEITKNPVEHSLSQIFIAFDLKKLSNFSTINQSIAQIIADFHQSTPIENGKKVRYPGERIESTKQENLKLGIPVSEKVWNEILNLSL